MPKTVVARAIEAIADEWANQLVRARNSADWFTLPGRVGARIAPLIGAAPDTVVAGDTMSIKVFQAVSTALQMVPDRMVVLSDNGSFPTHLYVALDLLAKLGPEYELRVAASDEVADAICDQIAAVMPIHVDHRTGRMHDMTQITARSHDVIAVPIWDLGDPILPGWMAHGEPFAFDLG